MITPEKLLIDGSLRLGGGNPRDVLNPATGGLLAQVPDASGPDVDDALRAATAAAPGWAACPAAERARVLRRAGEAIEARKAQLIDLLVAEVGKPISQARNELVGTVGWFTYTASLLETLTDEIRYTSRPDEEIWTKRVPHGVVGAIIPWNFPSGLVSRKVAPAIGAGNTIVLKPDEKTPLSALAIAEILAELEDLPPGVVNVVTGEGASVGHRIVSSPLTNYITMTGSSEAGRAILGEAAKAIKPVSLELGGKAPLIVLPDVDLDEAVAMAVDSRHLNCGQVCIAAERTFVHRQIYDAFVDRYVQAVEALPVGDPRDPLTKVGPKVSAEELDKTLGLVERAIASGTRVTTGGSQLTMPGGLAGGYWMAPTVLVDVKDDLEIMREEVFGPVTPISSFDSWDEVVARSNDCKYGLSAYLFTRDLRLAMRASRELSFGEIYINRVGPEELNGLHIGARESGFGGDDGPHGLDNYFRKQTVYVRY